MNFFKNVDRNKLLYNGLIVTFIILYAATAFVSWYHAITFFNIANAIWLSVLLSFVAEIGQSSVLFAILLTENKNRFLPWVIMIMLTTLQVIGNVVSSYKYIVLSNSLDFTYFQKSILFWVQTPNVEMFKVIIAYISGGLLPIIALSMTGLVAQQLKLRDEVKSKVPDKKIDEIEKKSTETLVEKLEEVKEVKEKLTNEEDEFGPIDLTNVEPDKLSNAQKDIIKVVNNELSKIDLSDLEHAVDELVEETPQDIELDDLDKEAAELTPEIIHPIGKYDLKFGPEFSKTMKEIVEEQKTEEKIVANVTDENILDLPKLDEKTKERFQTELSKQFEKDFIVPEEPDKKKRGRPPKQKDETVVVPKKEQGLLQKEEKVGVPLKESKSEAEPLKENVTKLFQNANNPITKDSIIEPSKGEEMPQESILTPPEPKTPYLDNQGVSVIDAKAVTLEPEVKKN